MRWQVPRTSRLHLRCDLSWHELLLFTDLSQTVIALLSIVSNDSERCCKDRFGATLRTERQSAPPYVSLLIFSLFFSSRVLSTHCLSGLTASFFPSFLSSVAPSLHSRTMLADATLPPHGSRTLIQLSLLAFPTGTRMYIGRPFYSSRRAIAHRIKSLVFSFSHSSLRAFFLPLSWRSAGGTAGLRSWPISPIFVLLYLSSIS